MKKLPGEEAVLSSIALAMGEPARMRILLSLLDGHARTSTELAAVAEVTPSTASAHLHRLTESALVRVAVQGRHRYYAIESRHVAQMLESLSSFAARTSEAFVPSTPECLRRARSCYDHMAGSIAVALHDHFIEEGWLAFDGKDEGNAYRLSEAGARRLGRAGIEVGELQGVRRRFAFGCLDWSERRLHIAGAFGAALLKHAIEKRWMVRELNSRALSLTKLGERAICRDFGLTLKG